MHLLLKRKSTMKNTIKLAIICGIAVLMSGCEIFFPDTNPRKY